jgi:hypothetical protein
MHAAGGKAAAFANEDIATCFDDWVEVMLISTSSREM